MSAGIQRLRRFRSERAAAGVEYAVCVGLLVLAAVAAISAWSGLSAGVSELGNSIAQSGGPDGPSVTVRMADAD